MVLRFTSRSRARERVLGKRSPARSEPRRMSMAIASAMRTKSAASVDAGDRTRGMDHMTCASWTFVLVHSSTKLHRMSQLETDPQTSEQARIAVTERTRVRRMPKRGSYDTAVVHGILDEALVCHVGFVAPGAPAPIVIPTIHVRVDDLLYIHGSAASHMLRELAKGLEVCVTVTLIDGLVFARSAFHHSMNYRSVVVFGTARLVEDADEKKRALDAIVDKLSPARTAGCRAPNEKELVATKVLAVPIVEVSAKVRTGGPIDDEEDMSLPYWAGVVPVQLARGMPRTASDCDQSPPLDLR
jgi:nitroimidazol reductase NimA-like FMN-containing flavoprotein (pyridoxamine 5'-phosphate oxidase superfamily)